MGWGTGRAATALVAVGLIVAGCSTPATSGSSGPSPSAGSSSVEPSSPSSPSPASPSAGASATPDPADVGSAEAAIAAARAFMTASSARFHVQTDRFRPNLPDQVLTRGDGVLDPAGDRGAMRYDFWVVNPGEPDLGDLAFDIVWDADDWWSALPGDGADREWTHATRVWARESGWVGRAQEEPLALLRFLAAAEPADLAPLEPAEIDGLLAERWLLLVPATETRAAYLPPDSYLGFETIFDRDTLPVELWVVGPRVVRTGYALDRDEIPAGGSDRHEVYYDWSGIGEPIELVVPPVGRIRDAGNDPSLAPSGSSAP